MYIISCDFGCLTYLSTTTLAALLLFFVVFPLPRLPLVHIPYRVGQRAGKTIEIWLEFAINGLGKLPGPQVAPTRKSVQKFFDQSGTMLMSLFDGPEAAGFHIGVQMYPEVFLETHGFLSSQLVALTLSDECHRFRRWRDRSLY